VTCSSSPSTRRSRWPPALLPDPALLFRAGQAVRICETPREAVGGAVAVYAAETTDPRALMSLAAPCAVLMNDRLMPDQVGDLLPVEQAVLRALVTGAWEG
jgi:hypothetical protein